MNIPQSYISYLRRCGLSERTIDRYSYQVPTRDEFIDVLMKYTGRRDMYQVTDIPKLKTLVFAVRASSFDIVGNYMYSCGLKKYIQWLETQR